MDSKDFLGQLGRLGEVVEILDKAGFSDEKRYPLVAAALRNYMRHGNPVGLMMILRQNPRLLGEAARRAYQVSNIEEREPFRPFVSQKEAQEKLRGKYRYGIVNPQGSTVNFNPWQWTLGKFIFGAQGTGKTHSEFGLLNQVLSVPPEVRGFNVVIIQRIKHDADYFAAMYPWVKVFEWKDYRYNFWEVYDWDSFEDKIEVATQVFAGENFMYALTVPILQYAAWKAYEDFGVLKGSKEFPTYRDIRKRLAQYLKEYGIEGYEMRNALGRLSNRVAEFEMHGDILNKRRGPPWNFWIKNDWFLNVVGISEFVARTTLIGLLYDIQRYYMKNPTENKCRILLFLDEARWWLDVDRDKAGYGSNKILENWFTTCRESGFGRILCTQEPQSISEFAISNCNYCVGFPVFSEGLERAQKILNLSDEQASFFLGMPRPGLAVMRYPGIDRPFLVRIPKW
ncbi:hypothetical protein TRIP_B350090 [uncultured Desulfatiglans sp.]|uniref:Uncharacterized protein n=1 Tax=Uncultured Desulfatiglans sp. TaxID=1748965 RepID=A0A653AA22_UNCDX|nr:hypothetical protein TRIP_B350090 [uncultured Desulfatiglans sp.]